MHVYTYTQRLYTYMIYIVFVHRVARFQRCHHRLDVLWSHRRLMFLHVNPWCWNIPWVWWYPNVVAWGIVCSTQSLWNKFLQMNRWHDMYMCALIFFVSWPQATLKIQLRWCIWVGKWLRQGLTRLGLEGEESNKENHDIDLHFTNMYAIT